MDRIDFRDDLILGVATASTQIEGGDTNNTWYNWTKNHDKTKDGNDCFLCNSHYKNYKEHIDLMAKLKIQSYRLSIEWSRIEPLNNHFNEEAINHYIDEIKYCHKLGISTIVTLHHFSNPLWFEELGGFKKKSSIFYFNRFTEYVAKKLNGLVKDFCTINEPNVYATSCFLLKEWINEESNFFTCMKVLRNMCYCHIEAYKTLHKIIKDANVGIALNLDYFEAYNKKSIIDKFGAWFYNHCFNYMISDGMGHGKFTLPLGLRFKSGDYFDFIGINYYTSHTIKFFKMGIKDDVPHNDLGWAITPNCLGFFLDKFHELYPNKEIYITENGTCDKQDAFRCKYLLDHLKIVNERPFVKRYYQWTFMDNFEWKEGLGPCFGIVEYHYEDATYTPRNSAYFYQHIIENRYVDDNIFNKYIKKE